MAMAKIRKGDQVIVIAGRDKGREGEVLKVLPKRGKVVVSGVNVMARHVRPAQAAPEGGIQRREAALDVSNVAIKDPKTGRPARVGFELRDGRKVRVLKGSGEVLNG